MSVEMRLEKLESEVFHIRKLLHMKDDNQHEVWNNMQAEVYELCRKNAEHLDRLEAGQAKLEAGQAKLEAGQAKLEAEVSDLKREVADLRHEVTDLKARFTRLETDVSDIKGMLQQLLDR
ncbi:hypothetical protein [Endozoicomonas euniceicola]|uniref:Uncharacterized protein n=1 Tax=Endozoicomonas euniceicola TaxID=1234143 RepID=A0ABY6GPU7_9GAMM|nr:hypothetical protein [Endozoicomonas euniceicola]UYM14171.1 hypothetical protein NX720_14790 [Endozoicomonas euniceicola]